MKALTLWEPWASLIASGDKLIETRDWHTDYRGKLLITAAAKKLNEAERMFANQLTFDLGYEPGTFDYHFGEIVALCDLIGCVEMTPEFIDAQTSREKKVGNWQVGRYAWILKDVIDLRDKAISIKGRQGLWTPDENQQKAVMGFANSRFPYC